MTLIKSALIGLFIICFLNLSAQNNVGRLTVGDKCPDVALALVNYSNPKVNLSDFKGKYIILDFWATWCAPCVSSFPKMDSLQKKFNDKLVILPVTDEKKEVVEGFMKKLL